jgi:hypothetical protein
MKKIHIILMACLTIYSCLPPDKNKCIYDDGVANIPPNVRDYFDEFTVGKRWVMANKSGTLVDTIEIIKHNVNFDNIFSCKLEEDIIIFNSNYLTSIKTNIIYEFSFYLTSRLQMQNSVAYLNICNSDDLENNCIISINIMDTTINSIEFKNCILYKSDTQSAAEAIYLSSNNGFAFMILENDTLFTTSIF